MNKKTSVLRFVLAFTALHLFAGCVSTTPASASSPVVQPRKKVAFFLDNGCGGRAVFCWVKLLTNSPELEVEFIDGKALRKNKLNGFDLIFCPGGGSARQLAAMQKRGQKIVKDFVRNGGAYLGICAGCFSVLNRPDRLQMLPFDWVPYGSGKTAVLAVDVDDAAAKALNIPKDCYWARYSGGPVIRKSAAPDRDTGKVLGVYKSSSGGFNRAPYNFVGTPAAVSAKYGKGKVVGVSFHPESHENSHDLALGYVHAAIGITPAPVYVKKVANPIRAGFMSNSRVTVRNAKEFMELDNAPEIDLNLLSGTHLNDGALHHIDVLIVPNGEKNVNQKLFAAPFRQKQLKHFLDRGGKIVAGGNGSLSLPKHPNVIRISATESLKSTVLKLFNRR